jgi:hypothetical protein
VGVVSVPAKLRPKTVVVVEPLPGPFHRCSEVKTGLSYVNALGAL